MVNFRATNQCINDRHDQPPTDPDDFLNRWNGMNTRHFSTTVCYENMHEENMECILREIEPQPLLSEVESAIKELK